MPPLSGVLKLNFDGSFIKEGQRGGYGGVIRDSSGEILCSYFGPINCVDSNGVDIFAMLMGCRELRKLEGHNAIIEGDPFSAIQWGLGKSTCPWKFADWVKEVHQISSKLGCSFHHILREANAIADRIAREGAFNLFSIVFFFLLPVSSSSSSFLCVSFLGALSPLSSGALFVCNLCLPSK